MDHFLNQDSSQNFSYSSPPHSKSRLRKDGDYYYHQLSPSSSTHSTSSSCSTVHQPDHNHAFLDEEDSKDQDSTFFHHEHRTAASYSSLTAPYAECPLITELHVPVPTALRHCFIMYEDNDQFHDTLNQMKPYPYRSRAPKHSRLERNAASQSQQASHQHQQRPSIYALHQKRHSLASGQIDRLVRAFDSHESEVEDDDDDDMDTLLGIPASPLLSYSKEIHPIRFDDDDKHDDQYLRLWT